MVKSSARRCPSKSWCGVSRRYTGRCVAAGRAYNLALQGIADLVEELVCHGRWVSSEVAGAVAWWLLGLFDNHLHKVGARSPKENVCGYVGLPRWQVVVPGWRLVLLAPGSAAATRQLATRGRHERLGSPALPASNARICLYVSSWVPVAIDLLCSSRGRR